ncbi:MAG: hypothetical protein WDN10_04455 [bacterium]
MQSGAEVSLALSETERLEAIGYIEPVMRERFKCEPPPTRGLIFIARAKGAIVGSIVLEGMADASPFPIEGRYAFDPKDAPYPFDRPYIVQGTRWIATAPGVSNLLVRTAMRVAYELGKRHMLIEAKPYSVKRLGELGIVCREIGNARLRADEVLAMVGEAGMLYFTEPPVPTLYLMELRQAFGE